jgi:hypothetical protein
MATTTKATKGSRWFPTSGQLKDPDSLERALRQVLTQHYALQDKFDALQKAHSETPPAPSEIPNGPSNTKVCGLPVEPVDTQTMANGATLKFNKTRGTFSFQ